MRAALLVVLAACGTDHKTIIDASVVVHDAPRAIDAIAVDAAPPTVFTVDCATSTPAATVSTVGFSFAPMMTTIAVGEIVKFTMPPEHDVIPDPSVHTDSGIHADFDGSTCLQFTVTGTFGFKCSPHQFKGSITVN